MAPPARLQRPCSQHNRPVGSFEPYDQPTDPSNGGMTLMCADLCDDDIGACGGVVGVHRSVGQAGGSA